MALIECRKKSLKLKDINPNKDHSTSSIWQIRYNTTGKICIPVQCYKKFYYATYVASNFSCQFYYENGTAVGTSFNVNLQANTFSNAITIPNNAVVIQISTTGAASYFYYALEA